MSNTRFVRLSAALVVLLCVAGGLMGCLLHRRKQCPPPSVPEYGVCFRFEAPLFMYEGRQYPGPNTPPGYQWYTCESRAQCGLLNHILVSTANSPLIGYIKHVCVTGTGSRGYEVNVCFGQDGKPALAAETGGNITRRLVILQDGAVVMAPLVRRLHVDCDASIGFGLSREEAAWLAGVLHSCANAPCTYCQNILFHDSGHVGCSHSVHHGTTQCGHAASCSYHQGCGYCNQGQCASCSGTCTHQAHNYKNCPHVVPHSCSHSSHCACGEHVNCHCSACACAVCGVAPPLGKEVKKASSTGR